MRKLTIFVGLMCASTQLASGQPTPDQLVETADTAAAIGTIAHETWIAVDQLSELEAACIFFRHAETDEEILLKLLEGRDPISPLQRADCCRSTMLRLASPALKSELVWSVSGMPVYDAKLAPHLDKVLEIAEAGMQYETDTLGEKVAAQLDSFEEAMGKSCVPVVARYRAIGTALEQD